MKSGIMSWNMVIERRETEWCEKQITRQTNRDTPENTKHKTPKRQISRSQDTYTVGSITIDAKFNLDLRGVRGGGFSTLPVLLPVEVEVARGVGEVRWT